MVLSEAQLQTWSNKGALTTSINAHESIRNALLSDNSPIKGKNMDFYLQGSYKNDTNVRGDSDVDVVIQLKDPFYRDISQLTTEQQSLYQSF
jgi:tRNA nucleotidyltransferase (CCA-adding enzyme)